MVAPIAAVRSWFRLDHEVRALAVAPAEARDRAHGLARLARQKRAAADALFRLGMRAEALSLAREALTLAVEAAESAGVSATSVIGDEALRAVRTAPARPLLEQDVEAGHRALHRTLAHAYDRLAERLLPFERTDAERRSLRIVRAAVVLAAVALAAAAVVRRVTKQPKPFVQCSATWGHKFDPRNVVDGDSATEWLLPDNSAGWLDVSPATPRPLRAIRLLNAKNRGGPDRATMDYRVEVYVDGALARSAEATFGAYDPNPSWREVPLGVSGNVERVRIVVRSWSGAGAGIAEVELVP